MASKRRKRHLSGFSTAERAEFNDLLDRAGKTLRANDCTAARNNLYAVPDMALSYSDEAADRRLLTKYQRVDRKFSDKCYH